MSILLIHRPESAARRPRRPLSGAMPAPVLAGLVDRATCAGRTIAIRACESDDEVVAAVQSARDTRAEIVLIDPGTDAAHGHARIAQALRTLEVPYIEVHDDAAPDTEPDLPGGAGRRLSVVHGFQAQGWTLAMAQALEHLGCADCESEVHVGL